MIPGSLFDFHVDYIASQGPMDETIPDFFQMIWDYNAPIIVMLAKEVESGRVIRNENRHLSRLDQMRKILA